MKIFLQNFKFSPGQKTPLPSLERIQTKSDSICLSLGVRNTDSFKPNLSTEVNRTNLK